MLLAGNLSKTYIINTVHFESQESCNVDRGVFSIQKEMAGVDFKEIAVMSINNLDN